MFTHCPHCQVYFRITAAQLKARGGLVRCGKCGEVFRADERLFDRLPAPATTKAVAAPPKERKEQARKRRRKTAPSSAAPPELPSFSRLAPVARKPRRLLWASASLLLVLLLAGQLAWLYRLELARQPALRSVLEHYCEWLDCDLRPPANVNRIELETSIAPHPKFLNLLRLRADLVNRAEHAQPFPRIEVTLTDSEGLALARRVFHAQQYLHRATQEDAMTPNVMHHALLDLTNPGNRAVGYEVRLLPAE